MVELALGWQIANWPLAGSGQAAEACNDRQSANATTARLIFRFCWRLCRDGNFMTDGALGTGNLRDRDAFGKSNSQAKLLLSKSSQGKQSSCTKRTKMSTKVHKEGRWRAKGLVPNIGQPCAWPGSNRRANTL